MRSDCLMGPRSLGDAKVLELHRVMVVQHCVCTKYLYIVYIKIVSFILCEFSLKKKFSMRCGGDYYCTPILQIRKHRLRETK